MKNYSNKIKELREKHGMTQAELAHAIGVSSRSTITMYENGTRRPSIENFEALADVFNVPISYLMEGNSNGMSGLLEQLRRSPGRRTMFSLTKNANEETINKVNKVIEAMIGNDDDDENIP